MKKFLIFSLAALMILMMAGCAAKPAATPEEPVTEPFPEAEIQNIWVEKGSVDDADNWFDGYMDADMIIAQWFGADDIIHAGGDIPKEFKKDLEEAWARAEAHLKVIHRDPDDADVPALSLHVIVEMPDGEFRDLYCSPDTEGVREFVDLLQKAADFIAQNHPEEPWTGVNPVFVETMPVP